PLASVVARLTVPDSTWVMTTSAPTTGWPLAPSTTPPTPAEVLRANAGAAARTATKPSVSLDNRSRRGSVVGLASGDEEWGNTTAAPTGGAWVAGRPAAARRELTLD